MPQLLVGADPELFVSKADKVVSAYGMVQGTKKAPLPVQHGAVQVDGMALEFNIDPARTADEFCLNINEVLAALRKMVPDDYTFEFKDAVQFDPEYMRQQPWEARELGCDPDYNAYTGLLNPVPDPDTPMRTAAGHVHLGWTTNQNPRDHEHFGICCEIAEEMDAVVGLWSVVKQPNSERRKLYGAAGAFRPKPYGCEYRVLSNFWLTDEKLMRKVFRLTHQAFENVVKDEPWCKTLRARARYRVQNVINRGKADWAAESLALAGYEEILNDD